MDGIIPSSKNIESDYFETQCFPLFSLLKALDNPKINLLVLDIEGAEFEVLKHVPWESVDIEVLLLELEFAGMVFPVESRPVSPNHQLVAVVVAKKSQVRVI